MLVFPTLGEPEDEIRRSWIRQNSVISEFWRIQLRIFFPAARLTNKSNQDSSRCFGSHQLLVIGLPVQRGFLL